MAIRAVVPQTIQERMEPGTCWQIRAHSGIPRPACRPAGSSGKQTAGNKQQAPGLAQNKTRKRCFYGTLFPGWTPQVCAHWAHLKNATIDFGWWSGPIYDVRSISTQRFGGWVCGMHEHGPQKGFGTAFGHFGPFLAYFGPQMTNLDV